MDLDTQFHDDFREVFGREPDLEARMDLLIHIMWVRGAKHAVEESERGMKQVMRGMGV